MSGRGRSHVLATVWYIQAAHSLKAQSVFSRALASNAKHFLLCATCKKRLCAIWNGRMRYISEFMDENGCNISEDHKRLFTFKYCYWYLSVKQWVSKNNTGKWWSRSCGIKEKKPAALNVDYDITVHTHHTPWSCLLKYLKDGRCEGRREGRKKDGIRVIERREPQTHFPF